MHIYAWELYTKRCESWLNHLEIVNFALQLSKVKIMIIM